MPRRKPGRPTTGSVLRLGGDTYAMRFRAYGRRRYVTLGTGAQGWTAEKAFEALDRTLKEVELGVWEAESSLHQVIERLVDQDPDASPRVIAGRVMREVSQEMLMAEIASTIETRAAGAITRRSRPEPKTGLSVVEPRFELPSGKDFEDLTSDEVRELSDQVLSEALRLEATAEGLTFLADAMVELGALTVRAVPARIRKSTLAGRRYEVLSRDECAVLMSAA